MAASTLARPMKEEEEEWYVLQLVSIIYLLSLNITISHSRVSSSLFHYVSYHIMIICTYHSHIHQMKGGTWGVSAGVPGHDDVRGVHVHGCGGEGYPLSLAKVCLSYRTLFYVRSFKSLKMIERRLTE